MGLLLLVGALVSVSPAADPTRAAKRDPGDKLDQSANPSPLTVELDHVPEKVALPADPDMNYLITAVVRGGAPAKVWLARSADTPFGVPLPPMGDGHYQINLADPTVLLALRRTAGPDQQFYGQCSVFAQVAGGAVSRSAAIRFRLEKPPVAHFSVLEGAEEVDSGARNDWFAPDKAKAVSVKVDPPLPGMTVQAEAGGRVWALQQKDGATFVLPVTPEVAAVWRTSKALHVRCDPPLHEPGAVTLRAIPTMIDLPPDGLLLTCARGSRVTLPGTGDFLSFNVRGVYSDSADVTLLRGDDPSRGSDPHVGEPQVYHFGNEQFAWFVARAWREVNDLSDTSKVELKVVLGKQAEVQILHWLFANLPLRGGSCCSQAAMNFNGKGYKADEANEQLEELFKRSGADDVAGFLEALAKREKETGSEVKVVLKDGNEKPLADWIRESVRATGWVSP